MVAVNSVDADPLPADRHQQASCSADVGDAQLPEAEAQALTTGDACGCAPIRGVQPPARKLKIVLRVEPSDVGVRAVVAVGADDCDPEFRVVEAGDLAGVLQSIPGVLAAAEARWISHTRYPQAPRPPSDRPQSTAVRRPAAATTAPGIAVSPPAAGTPAQAQLDLFA